MFWCFELGVFKEIMMFWCFELEKHPLLERCFSNKVQNSRYTPFFTSFFGFFFSFFRSLPLAIFIYFRFVQLVYRTGSSSNFP